jgi:hypothetical protein
MRAAGAHGPQRDNVDLFLHFQNYSATTGTGLKLPCSWLILTSWYVISLQHPAEGHKKLREAHQECSSLAGFAGRLPVGGFAEWLEAEFDTQKSSE